MPRALKIFPLWALLLLASCASPPGGLLDPDGSPPPDGWAQARPSLGLKVELAVLPNAGETSTALATARDDSVSDSLHMYIDVAVINAGAQAVLLPEQAQALPLELELSFVDLPRRKQFDRGRLELVVGWSETGLQSTERLTLEFTTDSTLHLSLPLSRVDSFRVADNVAVYGESWSPDRFVVASRVRRFSGAAPTSPAPALVGYVSGTDPQAGRLYVSGATVVITDTTRIEDSAGSPLALEDLRTGENRMTVTALAWAYSLRAAGREVFMVANGWEWREFTVMVARRP